MSQKGKYYITTPIYYPSAKLHIGHTYCTTIADSEARFHRLDGDEVFFLVRMNMARRLSRRQKQKELLLLNTQPVLSPCSRSCGRN